MNLRDQYIAQKDRAQKTADFYNKRGMILVMILGPKPRIYNGETSTRISIIGGTISHTYLDILKAYGVKFRILETIVPRG